MNGEGHCPMNGGPVGCWTPSHNGEERDAYEPLRPCPIPAASGGTSPLRGEEPPPHEWGGQMILQKWGGADV